jgi:hypothetical protein
VRQGLAIGDIVARLGHSRQMMVVGLHPGREMVDVEWVIGAGTTKRRVKEATAHATSLRLIRKAAK